MSPCTRCGTPGAHFCEPRLTIADGTGAVIDADALVGRYLMARGAGETRPLVRADVHAAAIARADAAEAEVARLRAIVEGRTTAPTPEEIEAHHAAGGRWLVIRDARPSAVADTLRSVLDVRQWARATVEAC